MPLYEVTAKSTKVTGGQRLERGMTVQVPSNSFSNPVISDKRAVADAFYWKYRIDIQSIGALNTAYLETKVIGKI